MFYVGLKSTYGDSYDACLMCVGNDEFYWYLNPSWQGFDPGTFTSIQKAKIKAGATVVLRTGIGQDSVKKYIWFAIEDTSGNVIWDKVFTIDTTVYSRFSSGAYAFRAIAVAANIRAAKVSASNCHFTETAMFSGYMRRVSGAIDFMTNASAASIIRATDTKTGTPWPLPPFPGSSSMGTTGDVKDTAAMNYIW